MCKSLIVLSGMAALAGGALLAQEHDVAALPRGDLETGYVRAAATQPAGNPANRWRYRFYNGQWWFYHPSNHWSYWNGNAWTPYQRQANVPPAASQIQPYSDSDAASYGYGRRLSGTIQREKNDTRGQSSEYFELRQPGSIQREKNEARGQSFEPYDIRPPGTIQREKNSPRG